MRLRPIAVALAACTALSACAVLAACTASSADPAEGAKKPAVVQPGAPGQTSRVLPADQAPEADGGDYTEADVRFMQGMIEHHAQALRMTALVPGRGTNGDLPLLARRIEISQKDEIGLMRRWLRARLKEVPSVDSAGHGHHGGGLMPGMLTEEQFAELDRATGAEFDRLFCTYMIQHHTGALRMVERLFADKGGVEPEVYQLASHIDSDQRIEIDRMRKILADPASR
ncbi:DUF305 domain-containing protein [Sphaerimonospora thailandensis]|uniref:Lipoprotein n=1 Tax=Sphaerimonospora thailandensis TaxID=795644 RepID=A0A8J3RB70_9ACTN|nr:DUF305 domain-containing protein [Sphaerimonospora thailandensis]GIH71370.1 lipoprotein [Sphaerimonospora thailandensis]